MNIFTRRKKKNILREKYCWDQDLVEVQHLVPVLCCLRVPEAVHVCEGAVDAGPGGDTQQVLGPAVAAAVRQPVRVGVRPVRHVAEKVL